MKTSLIFICIFIGFFEFANAAKLPAVSRSTAEFNQRLARDRNLVLDKKDEMDGGSNSALPSDKEKKLYDELVAAFERNDELSFQSRFQRMMADFPKSLKADECLYMAGMMSLGNKLYARAISQLSRIEKQYPNSNRVRAAKFAKASAYRKMNLKIQAAGVYREVISKYPGSAEANRAGVELKIIK